MKAGGKRENGGWEREKNGEGGRVCVWAAEREIEMKEM